MAKVTESMTQVVLSREQHLEYVAGEVTERRTDVALVAGYVGYLGLQLCERCSQHTDIIGTVRTVKNVKFSHGRYRALGPEMIPVYRQSPRR